MVVVMMMMIMFAQGLRFENHCSPGVGRYSIILVSVGVVRKREIQRRGLSCLRG